MIWSLSMAVVDGLAHPHVFKGGSLVVHGKDLHHVLGELADVELAFQHGGVIRADGGDVQGAGLQAETTAAESVMM